MRLSGSKKVAMGVAALSILIYHLWIPVFSYGSVGGYLERFLVAISYIGVDIFFFVSAYTMAQSFSGRSALSRKNAFSSESASGSKNPLSSENALGSENALSSENALAGYWKFILNRAIKLMPLFIIALICGEFLWFIPALMFTYIVFPPLFSICRKNPKVSFILLLFGWAGATMLLLGIVNKNQDLGIFLFRIPIIILGAYAAKFDGKWSKNTKLILGLLVTVIGVLITIKYGYMDKLTVPFKDTFYVTGLPLTIGLLLLIDTVVEFVETGRKKANRNGTARETVPRKNGPLKFLGNISLELYFTQVVLGSFLVGTIFKLVGSRIITNLLTFSITIAISAIIAYIYKFIMKPLK